MLSVPKEKPVPLSGVGSTLVKADIDAKLRAFVAILHAWPERAEITGLLEDVQALGSAPATQTGLRTWLEGQTSTPEKLKCLVEAKSKSVDRLRLELSAYVYHLLTLLEVFNDGLTAKDITNAEAQGLLDSIAKARQAFSCRSIDLLDDPQRGTSEAQSERVRAPDCCGD